MIGVAPRSIVYPVKAFDHNGSAFVSDIVLAIDWCIRNQVDIINMSFGMQSRSRALRSGRQGQSIRGHHRRLVRQRREAPHCRLSGSLSANDIRRGDGPQPQNPSFSNRGQFVDIYAPGDKIVSAWLQGRYHEMSGTSMATSHISGTIALLLAQRPGLRTTAIKSLLRRTSTPLRLRKGYSHSDGEVNALKFLREGMKLQG